MPDNKNETGLMVAKKLVGEVLVPADLTALDQIVTKLGDRREAGALEQASVQAAVKIVDDWDRSVTDRIRANASQARDVMAFIDGRAMGGTLADECANMFHDVLGDTPEWLAYQAALGNWYEVQQDEPLDVPADPGMTVQEADRLALDNKAARLAWTRRSDGAAFQVNKALKAYIRSLRALPEVMDAYANLKSYARKATRLASSCSEKAAQARINLQVGDAETRELLRQLLDFAKRI